MVYEALVTQTPFWVTEDTRIAPQARAPEAADSLRRRAVLAALDAAVPPELLVAHSSQRPSAPYAA